MIYIYARKHTKWQTWTNPHSFPVLASCCHSQIWFYHCTGGMMMVAERWTRLQSSDLWRCCLFPCCLREMVAGLGLNPSAYISQHLHNDKKKQKKLTNKQKTDFRLYRELEQKVILSNPLLTVSESFAKAGYCKKTVGGYFSWLFSNQIFYSSRYRICLLKNTLSFTLK